MIEVRYKDIFNLDSEEAIFYYCKKLESYTGRNIIYEPIFKTNLLIEYMLEFKYIDEQYLDYISRNIGQYFVSRTSNHAIFDAETVIGVIQKKEVNINKKELEDFFLLNCIRSILRKSRRNSDSRESLSDFAKYLKTLLPEGEDCETINLKIAVNPIPKDLRDMKLSYYNFDNIHEKLFALRELVSDESLKRIINEIEDELP